MEPVRSSLEPMAPERNGGGGGEKRNDHQDRTGQADRLTWARGLTLEPAGGCPRHVSYPSFSTNCPSMSVLEKGSQRTGTRNNSTSFSNN